MKRMQVCAGTLLILLLMTGGGAGAQGGESEMRGMVERFATDQSTLSRSYPINFSPARMARERKFLEFAEHDLAALDFDRMSQDGKIDYILLKNHLDYDLRQLTILEKQQAEAVPLLPFGPAIIGLEEARRRMEPVEAESAAVTLTALAKQIADAQRKAETTRDVKRHVAMRAAQTLGALRGLLRSWYGFYNGYDPIFTWWCSEPYQKADSAIQAYLVVLSVRLAGLPVAPGLGPAEAAPQGPPAGGGRGGRGGGGGAPTLQAAPGESRDIIGNPIGREALMSELAHEMIPYTPEELVEIANKEFGWCEAEMKKASREMGFGDDWHKALEKVKTLHVEPGKQPELIKQLALEAIKYVDDHDLVTVPPLCREAWRMEMMSPERQLVSPFFLGGETILVSYPTNTMTQEQKMMSMRGNNIHFSRATVFHELIPGHHLQGYMTARYRQWRSLFNTPFWVEGGALYWEFLFWNMGFPRSPEDRVGMLFWRMHRCARIIFSLSFHLEKMTPQQCIDFLVERVGHERENATAEVRRSFGGGYSPLYQCAYMLGGLQLMALRHELVDSGKMTNRQFHDAVLQQNAIPIEMVRAALTGQPLTRDFKTSWRFYNQP